MSAKRKHGSDIERQRQRNRERRDRPRPGTCPATHGNHHFTTFEVHIAPRRVCFFCGHVALPGEDPDDPHDVITDPPRDALDGRDDGGAR